MKLTKYMKDKPTEQNDYSYMQTVRALYIKCNVHVYEVLKGFVVSIM